MLSLQRLMADPALAAALAAAADTLVPSLEQALGATAETGALDQIHRMLPTWAAAQGLDADDTRTRLTTIVAAAARSGTSARRDTVRLWAECVAAVALVAEQREPVGVTATSCGAI